ncbi:hypothetical protein ACJVDH_05690 [Pedobacter sp. AW1-32]|uniref:hypothetical protein n=1 Tax=Pedobacter sp. AW1-32 TaxID=3383026 RepID=UPI003FF0B7F0
MIKLFNNPLKLVALWIAFTIPTSIILIISSGILTTGGEQWPLRIIGRAVILIPSGGLIISILSPFFLFLGAKDIGIW